MARLPAPEDYALSAPRPSRAVTDISPVSERPDLLTGKVMQDIGLMMQQEAEKLDDTVATDALNKLQEKQLDLTYGDDGFTKVLGGGVIKRPITTEYAEKIKRETEALSAGIGSTAARTKFQQHAAAANRGFTQKLFVHAAEQTDKYRTDTANAGVLVGAQMAKAGDVMSGLAKATPIVEAEIARRALEGDAAKTFRQEALGVVHAAAIDGLIARGDPAAATLYLKTNSEAMSKKQTDHYDPILKAQNAYVGGVALSQEAEAKGLTAKAAFDYITEKAGSNSELANQARAHFEHRAALKDKAIQELAGVPELVFASNGMGNRAMQMAMNTPEFMQLPPAEQAKRKEHWVQASRATQHYYQGQESHNRAEQDRRDRKKLEDPAIMEVFMNLANSPETLLTYSDAHLQGAYLPIMGREGVTKLIAYKHQVDSEAKRFKLPEALVSQAIPEALQKATGDAEVTQRKRYLGLVTEGLLDWKLQNPGKVPTPEEQSYIIRSATQKVTAPGIFGMFFGGNETPVYQIKEMPPGYFEALKKKAPGVTRQRALEIWARDPNYDKAPK